MAFVSSVSVFPRTSNRPTALSSLRRPNTPRCSIVPLSDRVLVRVDEAETQTAGGLFLTVTESNNSERTGTVVAVGPGRYSREGTLEEIGLEPGDRVIWKDEYGSEPVDTTAEEGKMLCLKVFSIVGKM